MYGSGPDSFAYEQNKANRTGRPRKLNAVLIEEICDLIAEGYSFAEAARIRLVGESTFYNWMSLGRSETAEPIYKELVSKVEEAAEFSEVEAIQALRISAIKHRNWKAAAWILERRFPEKYAKAHKCEESAG